VPPGGVLSTAEEPRPFQPRNPPTATMLVVLGLAELLRHRVRHHVVCCTIFQCHLVRCDGLAHEVVANIDVLGALVLDGVLGEANAPAVVDLGVDRPARDRPPRPLRSHTLHELVEPNSVLAGLT